MRTGAVVIGDAVLDVSVRPAIAPRPGADVPAAIRLGPGGQGANVAVRLARRGVSVRLACAIANDAVGRLVREALIADGVELHDLGAERTGTVVALLDPAGDRTMLSQRAPVLDGRVPDPEPPFDAAWLVVSGYVLLEPSAGLSATGGTPRRAVLGCALEPRQVDGWIHAAASLAPQLVVVNRDEARALGGGDGPAADLARRLADRFATVAIVTHEGGAAAALERTVVSVEGRRIEAVDTTGAGDAFAAALIAELSGTAWPPDDAALEDAMRAGVDLAGAVAGVEGAQARVAGEGR